jgi:hypothetical protein
MNELVVVTSFGLGRPSGQSICRKLKANVAFKFFVNILAC